MEEKITMTGTLEKTAVFNKEKNKRYELSFRYQGNTKKEKSALVICLNPASSDILISDTTTNYILNNLLPMGYTTITICNLFPNICMKLKTTEVFGNTDNREYIQEVLERNFHTIIVGYGNTFTTNKRVNEEKEILEECLKKAKGNIVELVDKEDIYSRLKTIHPLFAGQRFSGKWKFRKYVFHENQNARQEEK